MTGRVIQGFFIAATGPTHDFLRDVAQHATPPLAGQSGPPQPAFARSAIPAQAKAAPGRPPLVHRATISVQRFGGEGSFAIDPAAIGLARGGGQPLPQALLAKMEAAFGADFAAVRVHVGPQASRIGAIAFTTGNDLYFAPGQFQPDSVKGQQLLGHELAHVIQQRQGRVRTPDNGVAVVHDRMLEAEADRMGVRAAHFIQRQATPRTSQRAIGAKLPPGAPSIAIQRASSFVSSSSSSSSSSAAAASGLNSTDAKCSGQIYGIWKNEEYPGKIKDSSLSPAKCLYIGKTSPSDGNIGDRFIKHAREDSDCPWSLKQGCDYDEHDDDVWPYVVRNIWKYNGITAFDVQVAEQHYQQSYAKEKPAWNKNAALTLAKFNLLKDIPGVWTTKAGYASGWKPVK